MKFKYIITIIFALSVAVLADAKTDKVTSIMQTMTLREKIAQLFVISINENNQPATRARQDSLVEQGIGMVILMRGAADHMVGRANDLQTKAKIPLLVAVDAEWGLGMRFPEYPNFPRQRELGNIANAEKLLYEMGRAVGKDMKALNILVNFAPVVDIAQTGKSVSKRTDSRLFGKDVLKVSSYGAAYAKGMKDAGICACGKHFPGFCGSVVDSHVSLPEFADDLETVDKRNFIPYRRMIEDGLQMVMMGHMKMPNIDPSGTPMSISKVGVTDLLRNHLGFKGVVITDAIQMGAISNHYKPLESNLMAYRAGVDFLLMASQIPETMQAIEDSIKCGAYPIEELDGKVRRILELKASLGVLDDGYDPQVKDIDRRINAARRRDSALIRKMTKILVKCGYGKPVQDWTDPTLVLDRVGS